MIVGIARAVALLALLALAAVLPAGSAGAEAVAGRQMPGFIATAPARPAPGAAFIDAAGRKRHLAEFRGDVVLLVFWAVWCPACQAELPALERLAAALEGENFRLLTVAQQSGTTARVGGYLESRQLAHLAAHVDPGRRLGRAFGQNFFPTAILIDGAGREVGRTIGPAGWNSAAGRALIRSHLKALRQPHGLAYRTSR